MPNDPRVFALAKASGLTTREAFAAAAECWAWVALQSVDDIVVNTAPDSLDAVVDVPGFGAAMVQTGLVGTVDGGLVLPAELRRRPSGQRGGGATAVAAEDEDEKIERERKQARIRQRRRRAEKALTKPVTTTTTPAPVAEDTGVKWTPRRLGTVDGHDVMLLFSKKTQAWFYCLKDASPEEWTASVADSKNPSFAEALAGLLGSMKRKDSKGFVSSDTFRPSMAAVVAAAERYREARASAAADAARRDEANQALAEASAEDQDDGVDEPAERDSHADVTHDERDSVTVTEVSRSKGVTCQPNPNDEGDFGNVDCHAAVTEPVPSSSSSSVCVSHEDRHAEKTTTPRGVTPAERDHEDRILDRILGDGQSGQSADPVTAAQQTENRQRLERIAAALDTTVDAVEWQRRYNADILLARCAAAGVDPKTGHRVARGAPSESAGACGDIGTTTDSPVDNMPAAGSVGARDGDEPDEDLDQQRVRLAEGLRKTAVSAAADIGVKYA